jgi:hypothetical protein
MLIRLIVCARDLDREGIGECHFPETIEASRGAWFPALRLQSAVADVDLVRALVSHSSQTVATIRLTWWGWWAKTLSAGWQQRY